jgi:hypothetical protein
MLCYMFHRWTYRKCVSNEALHNFYDNYPYILYWIYEKSIEGVIKRVLNLICNQVVQGKGKDKLELQLFSFFSPCAQ